MTAHRGRNIVSCRVAARTRVVLPIALLVLAASFVPFVVSFSAIIIGQHGL